MGLESPLLPSSPTRAAAAAATSGTVNDSFLDALEAQAHLYHEELFYACREYLLCHELNHKKQQRTIGKNIIETAEIDVDSIPLIGFFRGLFGSSLLAGAASKRRGRGVAHSAVPNKERGVGGGVVGRDDAATYPEVLHWQPWMLLRYLNPFASRSGTVYLALQCLLAVASVAILMFESAPDFNGDVFPTFKNFWPLVDVPIAVAFALDVIVYFVLLPWEPSEYSGGVSKRNMLAQGRVITDIVSILPTFLVFLEHIWYVFGVVQFLKILRVLRLLRTLRVLHTVDVLLHTMERSLAPLAAPLCLFMALVLVFSTMIYYAERGEYDALSGLFLIDDCDCLQSTRMLLDENFNCPKRVTPFVSIPHAMWFIVVTLTTLGYGDMTPLCNGGRFLASACMFLGSVIIAMPIAIVGMYYTNIVMSDAATGRDPMTAFGRRRPIATVQGSSAKSMYDALAARKKEEERVQRRTLRAQRKKAQGILYSVRSHHPQGGEGTGSDRDASDSSSTTASGSSSMDEDSLSLKQRLDPAATMNTSTAGKDGPSKRVGLETGLTFGEQMLCYLDRVAQSKANTAVDGVVELSLRPPPSLLRDVNGFIDQLFQSVTEPCNSLSGIRRFRQRLAVFHEDIVLEHSSSLRKPKKGPSAPPRVASMARPLLQISLLHATTFALGAMDGQYESRAGLPLSKWGRESAQLGADLYPMTDAFLALSADARLVRPVGDVPQLWALGMVHPQNNAVAICPLFPYQVRLAGKRLTYGQFTTLLLGDRIEIACRQDPRTNAARSKPRHMMLSRRASTMSPRDSRRASRLEQDDDLTQAAAEDRLLEEEDREGVYWIAFEFLRVDGGGGQPRLQWSQVKDASIEVSTHAMLRTGVSKERRGSTMRSVPAAAAAPNVSTTGGSGGGVMTIQRVTENNATDLSTQASGFTFRQYQTSPDSRRELI